MLVAVVWTSLFGGLSACAAEKTKAKTEKKWEITKEQRQKMAEMHEKMAACLKSDKPFEECHKQMASSCSGGCGMMGSGHHHESCAMHDDDAD